MAVFPAPITTTRGGTLRDAPGLVAGNQVERVGHARQLFARDAELVNRAQANAQEDGIVVAFKFGQPLRVDHRLEVKLDPELREHFNLAQALDQRQLVFGDAVGIQASGQRTRVEEVGADAAAAQFCSAGERRRARRR